MRPGWLALLSLGGVACACPTSTRLSVEDESGETLPFCVEVADTEAARRRGLRGRDALAPDEGLLLTFSLEDEICIVNEGVAFDIDLLYARDDGTVVAVERNVRSGDPSPRCHAGVAQVLETAAGALDPLPRPTRIH